MKVTTGKPGHYYQWTSDFELLSLLKYILYVWVNDEWALIEFSFVTLKGLDVPEDSPGTGVSFRG